MAKKIRCLSLIILGSSLLLVACTKTWPSTSRPWDLNTGSGEQQPAQGESGPEPGSPLTTARPVGASVYTPTPDAPHPIPGLRTDPEDYIVQAGDTLGQISDQFGISIAALAEANDIEDINILEVGQPLVIPVAEPVSTGSSFKIIPDSELVAGPLTALFDVPDFISGLDGYLARYEEDVEGVMLSGAEIVQRVAMDYSINPRLLLAVLEYQSGWLTDPNPRDYTFQYTLGWENPDLDGLYKQLAWAANELNRGYYLWRVNGIGVWTLPDGIVVPIDPTINAGTAAVQHLFSRLYGQEIWERTVSSDGIFKTYQQYFGYAFDYAHEPLIPPGLTQPNLQLPFEEGVDWSFTGGPHGGWGDGSAWAALDFAPYDEPLGCNQSENWVVAMADGMIVRADHGAVVQDLDGDSMAETGWSLFYMHIETRDRVAVGTYLLAGERVGHPSCEGGFSTGTHVHIARRYNGEWISADQGVPFVLDGWRSSGAGNVYDGALHKNDHTIVAENGHTPENIIQR
jgi:LasA protease